MRVPAPPVERDDDVAVVDDSHDRIYVSSLLTANGRTHAPSSPLPFVDTASYEGVEVLSQARQTIQVRVQQAETTTTETV